MSSFAYFCVRTENIYTLRRSENSLYRMNSLFTLICAIVLGWESRMPELLWDEQPHLFLSEPLCLFDCKEKFFLQLFITLIRW